MLKININNVKKKNIFFAVHPIIYLGRDYQYYQAAKAGIQGCKE